MRTYIVLLLLTFVRFTLPAEPGPEPTVPGDKVPAYDTQDEQQAWVRYRRTKRQVRKAGSAADELVIQCMQDKDVRTRLQGIELVKDKPSVAVVDVLLDLLRDPDWWVRDNAGERLWVTFGAEHAALVPECVELLKSRWPHTRANAVLALANLKDARILEPAAGLLDDPDAHVLAHTLMTLGAQGGERAEKLIVAAVTKPNTHAWEIWYGLDALKAMNATAALRELTRAKHGPTRLHAAMNLTKMGDTEVLDTVAELAADEGLGLKQRTYCVAALKRAAYKGPIPELPTEIIAKVTTPAPKGKTPAAYLKPRHWTARIHAVDLGQGRVYLGWAVTSAPDRKYRVERMWGKGWQVLGETTAGSLLDTKEIKPRVDGTVTYRVVNEKGKASPMVHLIPRKDTPEQPALVHVIANARNPVVVSIPGLHNWSIEWNMADLDNDGYFDFMVGQTAARVKRAYTWNGKLLWQRPYTRGSYYTHPVRMVAADLDGNGMTEMVCFEDDGDRKWLMVCDGATGRIRHTADMTKLTCQSWERRDKILLIDRTASGREDTIVFTHNTYGCPQAVAFTPELKHLWTHSSKWAKCHKARIIDLNGDGKDEMILGGDCIDSSGKLLWRMPPITGYGHADFIEARDFNPKRPGIEIAAAGCDADTAWMTDWQGKLLWLQKTGHAQSLVPGRFTKDPGTYEVWVRRKMADDTDDRITFDGRHLGEPPVTNVQTSLDWDGDASNGHEVLLHNGSVYNPATGKTLLKLNARGPKRAADVLGDSREEVIIINPDKRQIEIYTDTRVNPRPEPDRMDHGYWRYRSREKRPYGREYINPPS